MGCVIENKLDNITIQESILTNFFSLLPIRDSNADTIVNEIVNLSKQNLDYIINYIQSNYFNINTNEFNQVKILSSYFLHNQNLNNKYILFTVLLFCKYNLVKLYKASIILFKLIGVDYIATFNEIYIDKKIIKKLLAPAVELYSGFTISQIITKGLISIEDTERLHLQKRIYCSRIQNEYIVNVLSNLSKKEDNIKGIKNNKMINFVEVLKSIDLLIDSGLRAGMVELYRYRAPSKEYQLNENFCENELAEELFNELKIENIKDNKSYKKNEMKNITKLRIRNVSNTTMISFNDERSN